MFRHHLTHPSKGRENKGDGKRWRKLKPASISEKYMTTPRTQPDLMVMQDHSEHSAYQRSIAILVM